MFTDTPVLQLDHQLQLGANNPQKKKKNYSAEHNNHSAGTKQNSHTSSVFN
jgi:hypothetical protein